MEQIVLNFDADEFDAFDGLHDFFTHQTRRVRDKQGRPIKQAVQAMEMDYSPSQWSQKVNQSNNTSVTLNDADKFTELFGDTRWIHYLVWKHIVRSGCDGEIEELERQLKAAKARQARAAK